MAALMYAAPTSVGWDGLRGAVAGREPLTGRERCSLLIAAVNDGCLAHGDWTRLVGAPVLQGDVGPDDQFAVPETPLEQTRAVLAAVVQNAGRARRRYSEATAEVVRGKVVLLPEMRIDGSALVTGHHVVAESAGVALTYALMLFLDPAQPFGADLCRCNFHECRRFFFVERRPGAGRPQRRYCPGTDHATLADYADARRRVKKWRKNHQ